MCDPETPGASSMTNKRKAGDFMPPGEPSAKKRKMREPKFSEEETTFIFQQTGKKQRLLVERHGPTTTEDKKNKSWERLAQDVTSINGQKHIRAATHYTSEE